MGEGDSVPRRPIEGRGVGDHAGAEGPHPGEQLEVLDAREAREERVPEAVDELDAREAELEPVIVVADALEQEACREHAVQPARGRERRYRDHDHRQARGPAEHAFAHPWLAGGEDAREVETVGDAAGHDVRLRAGAHDTRAVDPGDATVERQLDATEVRGDLLLVTVDDGGPENLVIAWYADSSLLGSSTADAGGYTSLSTELPEGEVRVTLRAVDGTGLSGEDSVEVSCWGDQAEYVLSGGDSIFDHWSVDDDVVVTLNGTAILTDTDKSKSSHAPLAFEASVGDILRIVATDNNFCEKNLDALVLHWGTEVSQELNAAVCVSSCPEDACYDPDYSGPWPNEFLDKSYVIAIP